jgi:hypothetical protein
MSIKDVRYQNNCDHEDYECFVKQYNEQKELAENIAKWEKSGELNLSLYNFFVPKDDITIKSGSVCNKYNPLFIQIYNLLGNCKSNNDVKTKKGKILMDQNTNCKGLFYQVDGDKILPDPKRFKVFNPSGNTTNTPTSHLAMASLVHILVIFNPEFKRIYNAVTIKNKDIDLIDEMVTEGLKVAKKQRKTLVGLIGDLFKDCYKARGGTNTLEQWLCQSSNGQLKSKGTWLDSLKAIYDSPNKLNGMDLDRSVLDPSILDPSVLEPSGIKKEPQWVIGFHPHPTHSIGYLHLHIMDKTLMTRYSKGNFDRTVEWNKIKKFLN